MSQTTGSTSGGAAGGSSAGAASSAGLTGLQKVVAGLFLVVLGGSVAARAALGPPDAAPAASSAPAGAHALSLVPTTSEPSAAPAEAQGLEQYLPYLTEASLFGLIGFALGYTTRKIFKVALILIALAFIGAQVGVHQGWFEVDWGGLLQRLNDWVFNLKADAPITDFLTDRVPAAAALLIGWVVGFRRG